MKRHVKVTDGVPAPYKMLDLRRDEGISIRDNPSPEILAEFGVYQVVDTEPPELAPGEMASLRELPELVDGQWISVWDVTEQPE